MGEQVDRAPEAPVGVDTDQPSSARIYDAYLDGSQNWEIDRKFAAEAVREFPLIKPLARANRKFLGRVVREALDAGIDQFLDLGSGVPTVGNVHEVITDHKRGKTGRVVYVDYEPVAVAHSELILERQQTQDWTGVVHADLRQPDTIIRHRTTRRVIDFSRPVCLLLVSVLHFVGDETDIGDLLAHYRQHLAPGSWLALSHITTEAADPEGAAQITRLADKYKTSSQNPAFLRTRANVESWFDGFTIQPPGIVKLQEWRPTGKPSDAEQQAGPFMWCAVGERTEAD